MIKKKLGDKYVGQPLDEAKQDQLAKDLNELTGTARFDSLDYQIGEEQGKKALLIGSNDIGGGRSKPTRLEVGVDVNSIASDAVNFNLLARLTFFDIGKHGSEWRNDLQLGSNFLLASEYYRPLGQSRFFVAPHAAYERRGIDLYIDSNRIANYLAQNGEIGVDIGYDFNTSSELRAGYAFGYQSISLRIGDPLLPGANGAYSTAGLRWNYDSLDNAVVPTRGILSRNRANYYFKNAGSVGGFTQAENQTSIFHSLNDRNILFGIGSAGTTFGANAPVLRQFTLGGLFRVGGYGFEEFRGSNYLHGGVGLLTSSKAFPEILGRKTYLGAWYEGGSMFESISKANYRQSLSGGAILDTPIGPIFLGGGINERGRGQFYFSFGRIFR
jgi:NTE family protein